MRPLLILVRVLWSNEDARLLIGLGVILFSLWAACAFTMVNYAARFTFN
jgi:hypothetical protein